MSTANTTLEAPVSVSREKRFSVKGINDERDFCMCCGRGGLKRVVWIEDHDTGEVRHFGVVCAVAPGKAFGLKTEIEKAVRLHDKEKAEAARQAYWAMFKAEGDKAQARRDALYLERGGTYREWTAPNGRKGMVTADTELMNACHEETVTVALKALPKPPRD